MKKILFNETAHLGEIILNRPEAYNALDHEMILTLRKQLSLWANAPHIKIILISSHHDSVFCAGGDIKKLYQNGESHYADSCEFFYDEYRLNHFIFNYPKPYIAFLNGLTMGGGAGVSIHASHRIGTPRFSFAMPETGIGFYPDIGGSYFLSRCPDHLGTFLGLTGTRIATADALFCKLIDYSVNTTSLEDIKSALLSLERYSNQAIRESLLPFHDDNTTISLPTDIINQCFYELTIENIMKRLDENKHPWAKQTKALLQKKSPLSLKITIEQLQRGKKYDLAQCLKMEYRLTQHFLKNPNFYEGIKAAVITKNQRPQWSPTHLEDVTKKQVAIFFEAIGKELTF